MELNSSQVLVHNLLLTDEELVEIERALAHVDSEDHVISQRDYQVLFTLRTVMTKGLTYGS